MSLRFALGAEAEFGDYLEKLARERGEDVALRESQRVLGELIRVANLSLTGRRVHIEGESAAVFRWVVPPYVVYYTRTDDCVALRLFHARGFVTGSVSVMPRKPQNDSDLTTLETEAQRNRTSRPQRRLRAHRF